MALFITRSHIYAHINIFRLNLGCTQESQIHTCTCVKDTLYIHIYKYVREFLATKGITIGVLLCQDIGVGSRMPIIGPVDCHKQILTTPAELIFSACLTSLLSNLAGYELLDL